MSPRLFDSSLASESIVLRFFCVGTVPPSLDAQAGASRRMQLAPLQLFASQGVARSARNPLPQHAHSLVDLAADL
jgi:hypothetical protein